MSEKLKGKNCDHEIYVSKSANETEAIAQDFAKNLKGGEVIALVGDLGSGKTTFTKGLAKELGIKIPITSPTFVILKQYKIKKSGLKRTADNLIHMDCYRLKSAEDALGVGITDYLGKDDTIFVIEWPEILQKNILNCKNVFGIKNIINIKFSHLTENKRKIDIA